MPLRLMLKWLSLRWRLAKARRAYDKAERIKANPLHLRYYEELIEQLKRELRDTCHLIQRSPSFSLLRRLRF